MTILEPRALTLPPLPYPALVRFDSGEAERAEILVIGSGAAALRAALEAAKERDVLVLTKKGRTDASSQFAQGGIAAAMSEEDSVEDHVADTLRTGGGLCDEAFVARVLSDGVECVEELLRWGAEFDRDGGRLHFGLEGGHSRRRVLHHGDETGAEIQATLWRAAAANPRIRFLENAFAVDFLRDGGRCAGVLAHVGGGLRPILAPAVILATGGLARIFRESTNPPVATGDGIAMALRAGAELMDMELVQFHPTTLYLAGASRALISEAVRGAGAVLRDRNGAAFMKDLHPMADLAPRDVVSRAIVRRMLETDDTQVYLDVRRLPAEARARFPGLLALCAKFNLDTARDLIPVRPAAHYTIGGVRTDALGRASLPGLWACGECAATGFHGANRLASNSLLECLVFGRRAGRDAAASASAPKRFEPLPGPPDRVEEFDLEDMTRSLRSLLWRNAGIERDARHLEEALSRMAFWSRYALARRFDDPAGWELQNSLTAGEAVVTAALAREESRGVHYRSDHPEPRDDWARHIVVRAPRGG